MTLLPPHSACHHPSIPSTPAHCPFLSRLVFECIRGAPGWLARGPCAQAARSRDAATAQESEAAAMRHAAPGNEFPPLFVGRFGPRAIPPRACVRLVRRSWRGAHGGDHGVGALDDDPEHPLLLRCSAPG